MRLRKIQIRLLGLVVLLFFFGMIGLHNVSKKLTTQDISSIEQLIAEHNLEKTEQPRSFEAEIKLIVNINQIFQSSFRKDKCIPNSQPREPVNFFHESQSGLCYDWCRSFEKVLTYFDFEVRHVALFKNTSNQHNWQVLTSKKTTSHAVFEIKTQKGWMLIDPFYNWLGFVDNETFSTNQLIGIDERKKNFLFRNGVPQKLTSFFESNTIPIYGLYSRNGKHYWPYNFIPDYNFFDLSYNVNVFAK